MCTLIGQRKTIGLFIWSNFPFMSNNNICIIWLLLNAINRFADSSRQVDIIQLGPNFFMFVCTFLLVGLEFAKQIALFISIREPRFGFLTLISFLFCLSTRRICHLAYKLICFNCDCLARSFLIASSRLGAFLWLLIALGNCSDSIEIYAIECCGNAKCLSIKCVLIAKCPWSGNHLPRIPLNFPGILHQLATEFKRWLSKRSLSWNSSFGNSFYELGRWTCAYLGCSRRF